MSFSLILFSWGADTLPAGGGFPGGGGKRPAAPHVYATVHLGYILGKKLEDICPSTHNMEVPNVKRKDYQLIGVEDDFLSLMDDTGDTRDDLKCPEDIVGDEIREAIASEKDILVCIMNTKNIAFGLITTLQLCELTFFYLISICLIIGVCKSRVHTQGSFKHNLNSLEWGSY